MYSLKHLKIANITWHKYFFLNCLFLTLLLICLFVLNLCFTKPTDLSIFSKQNLKIWIIKVFVLSQVNEFFPNHHIHMKNKRSKTLTNFGRSNLQCFIEYLFLEYFWAMVGCWNTVTFLYLCDNVFWFFFSFGPIPTQSLFLGVQGWSWINTM